MPAPLAYRQLSTSTQPQSAPAHRDGYRETGRGLMHDWPNVAPAMMAILPCAVVIVAIMWFAERTFAG